jgi:hypothetical protein
MCIVCKIPKATYTRSEFVILTAFQCISGCTNALQSYVICTLPILCNIYLFASDLCL